MSVPILPPSPTGPTPPLPSADELLTQDYGFSPFSQGITSDDFRQQHRDYGERVRWFKGYENAGSVLGPSGETPDKTQTLLIEQAVRDEVRVLFSQSKRTIQTAEFGIFEVGTVTVSALPDEIELARGDRLIRLDRTILHRYALEPSGQATDALSWRFVASILCVLTPSGTLSPDEYTATEHGIEWQGAPPQTPMYVEYRSYPEFEFMGEDDRLPPLGTDNISLPKIGVVRLVKSGD